MARAMELSMISMTVTSNTRSGEIGRAGLLQPYRLPWRGMSWRPISSTYLKPAVVTRAIGGVLPSRIALVAVVVPWRTRMTSGG
jgi:hypothetical protein